MLYVLPPPRAPNPPSPWDSIICGSSGANASVNSDSYSWGASNSSSNNNPSKTSAKRKTRLYSKLSSSVVQTTSKPTNSFCVNGEDAMGRHSKSLSECYFAGKGTALVLPEASETQKSSSQSTSGCNIQKHLQSMFYLLRPEETLKMAVKLESVHPVRSRYLVVVSRMGRKAEESCLLGIDCNEKTTVGLVLRVLADTSITLDGDGGFSVTVCGRHHIFKPVSVQAMWSALQTLHKLTAKARHHNHFHLGPPHTHSWISHYEVPLIQSDRSCLNEWHAMDSLESRRPPSPDSVLRTKPTEREQTERVIRDTLKEIMMSVDLDEVTSKCIRGRLEEELDMDLGEYKSFIDEEMLVVLGQMDAPTEVFEYVYLGSEWNASNYEELQRNGVGHILNVTREIDNFFPGTFNYLNIRVYDDEKTDLLKYWDDTFKYISRAKQEGSKVLVHCKMGVSRSASVVIAYAMKAYNWNFDEAMRHVKEKRNCIKPNSSFITQLETYQGILDAMKNKEKLQRSKSESNLKSPLLLRTKNDSKKVPVEKNDEKFVELVETSVEIVDQVVEQVGDCLSGEELRTRGIRPKSWSPSNQLLTTNTNYNNNDSSTSQVFLSLENINNQQQLTTTTLGFLMDKRKNSTQQQLENNNVRLMAKNKSESGRNVLLPCDNGESYSVSPNQIVHLPNQLAGRYDVTLPSVKDRVSELEDKRRQLLCLNLTPVFEQELLLQQQGEDDGDSLVRIPFLVDSTINDKSSECVIDSWDPGERDFVENGKELTEKCKELTEKCKKQTAGKCKELLTGKCKELLTGKCKEQLAGKNKEQCQEQLADKGKEQFDDKSKELLDDKDKEQFEENFEQQLPERLKQQLLQKLDQQLLPQPLDKQLPQALDKQLPHLLDQQLPHRFEGKQLPEKLEQELPERLKQQLLQKHEKYLSEKFEQLLPEKLEKQLPEKLEKQLPEKLEKQLYDKLEKQLSDKLEKQLSDKFDKQLSAKFDKQLSDKLEKQLSNKFDKQISDKFEKQLSDKLQQVSEKLEGKQPQKLLTNCDNKKTTNTNKSTRSNRRRKSIGEELFASDKEDDDDDRPGQQLQRDELLKRVDLQNMLREDLLGIELRKHDDLWKISGGNKSHPSNSDLTITLPPPPPVTPSRQSSCSSIDSSGVSVTPSRNSSCSTTTTTTSLPSRNSSWGSYDMRGRRRRQAGGQQPPVSRDEHDDEDSDDDEYHHCEAVNATLVNHQQRCHYRSSKSSGDVTTSAIDITRNHNNTANNNNNNNKLTNNSKNNSSGGNKHSVLLLDRLSVSAPPPATAKHYLTSNAISKSTSNIATSVVGHTSQLTTAQSAAGIVKSLKKEFESKNDGIKVVVDDVRVLQAFETTEDKFKQLLGKFEVKQANNSVVSVVTVDPLQRRVISGNPEGNGVYRNRHSCIEVSVEKSPVRIRQKMTGNDELEFANKSSRPPKGPISQNLHNTSINPQNPINHHNSSQNPSINPQTTINLHNPSPNHQNPSINPQIPINHHNSSPNHQNPSINPQIPINHYNSSPNHQNPLNHHNSSPNHQTPINHHNSSIIHNNPSTNPLNNHYNPINHHNPINSINTTTKQYGKSHPLARINTTTFKSSPPVHHTPPPVLYNHPPVLYHTM